MGERDFSAENRNRFIDFMIKESKCGRNTEILKDYIKLRREESPGGVYSILKHSEIGLFAERVKWIHKKLKSRN